MKTSAAGLLAVVLGLAGVAVGCSSSETCSVPPCVGASNSASAVASSSALSPKLAANADRVALDFREQGQSLTSLNLRQLVETAAPETIVAFDPYYQREKRFRGVPLAKVLAFALRDRQDKRPLRELEFLLRASDGYTVPFRGERLLEPGAFIAFEDLEVPAWEPIGPQKANPGPFYLVWSELAQQSLETHPRPWQLRTIEVVSFEQAFPHVAPAGEKVSEPAKQGYALFRQHCILCHAINREGGRVGPELNVPQSIVEYREASLIKAYIRNPRTFRYGNMPAQPQLSDTDLDNLLAYFGQMKQQKFDPDAEKEAGH